MASKGSLLVECCKIMILLENALNRSYSELNFLQRTLWMHILSPSGVELGAPKIVIFEIQYTNGEIDWFFTWTLQKIPIISKNGSNKSYLELNFLQKTQ